MFAVCVAVQKVRAVALTLSSLEKAGRNSSTWWEMLCKAQGLTPVPAHEGSAWVSALL